MLLFNLAYFCLFVAAGRRSGRRPSGRPRMPDVPPLPTPYLTYTERCDPNHDFVGIFCRREGAQRFYLSCRPAYESQSSWKYMGHRKDGACPRGYLCRPHSTRVRGRWAREQSVLPPQIDCLPARSHPYYIRRLEKYRIEAARKRAKALEHLNDQPQQPPEAADHDSTSRPQSAQVCHAFDLNLPAPEDDRDDSSGNVFCAAQILMSMQSGTSI